MRYAKPKPFIRASFVLPWMLGTLCAAGCATEPENKPTTEPTPAATATRATATPVASPSPVVSPSPVAKKGK